MKVYKKRTYWSLYLYMIVFTCVLVSIKVVLPSNYFEFSTPLIGFVTIQFGVILFIQWKRARSSFTIKEDSVILQNFFGTQEVPFGEIIGYETHYWYNTSHALRYILIKTDTNLKRAIKIYPSYVGFEELLLWLETKITNLDKVKEKQEWSNILENHTYGLNTIERLHFIKKAKKVARILNISAMLLLPFSYFPATYSYILYPSLLLPLLAIYAIYHFKGIIKLEHFAKYELLLSDLKKKQPRFKYDSPSVFTDVFIALALPTLISLVIVFKKYVVINYNGLWSSALVLTTILFLFCVFRTREFQYRKMKSYGKLVFIFLIFYGYSCASILGLNCTLDSSLPAREHSVVIDKLSDNGNPQSLINSPRYYLKIKSVKLKKPLKLTVAEQEYRSLEVGANYSLNLRNGKFNMCWVANRK